MQQFFSWLIALVIVGVLMGMGVLARRVQQPKVILIERLPIAPDALVLSALVSVTRGFFGSRGWKWSFGSVTTDDGETFTTVDIRNGAEWIRLTYCTSPPAFVSREQPFRVLLTMEEYVYDARWISLLLFGKFPKGPAMQMRTKLLRALPKAANRAENLPDGSPQGTAV